MGRGVNMDDIHFCGYNGNNWMTTANAEQSLESVVSGLMAWKPTFVRVWLAMNSYGTASTWTTNPAQYATPMTNVIRALGSHPGVYVLVTVRSDSTMVESDPPHEETFVPTQATDATYKALVDTFANDKFVMIGLDNEPGTISGADLVPLMSHAVGAIRAEEDRLGVPHHIISVPGDHWASDISFYSASPLPYDNVVYEIHGYPPPAVSYTFSNIPVIIGEYGSLTDPASFYADMEAKQIPNLAWDFSPFVDCAPDLLVPSTTGSATPLTPSSWGSTVYNYLTSH
jgi:hypothetical protein